MSGCWTVLIILHTNNYLINYTGFTDRLYTLLTSIQGNCHGDKSRDAMFTKFSVRKKKVARSQYAVTLDKLLAHGNDSPH